MELKLRNFEESMGVAVEVQKALKTRLAGSYKLKEQLAMEAKYFKQCMNACILKKRKVEEKIRAIEDLVDIYS